MPSEDPPQDVLSSLPRTRPQRPSPRRDAARKPAGAKSAGAAPKPTAGKRARSARSSSAGPRIPPAGFAAPREEAARPAPSGVELVGTAVQAAGELAQIGLAVGGQAVKSALGRLARG